MTAALTFDPQAHEYRVGPRVLLSVTQILQRAGLIDTTWYTPESATRGRYVADATAMYDAGELDQDELDPALKPYVEAWAAFRLQAPFVIEQAEQPLHSEIYGFAGTPDRVGLMGGAPCVLDIKTGAPERWHALQLAAYSMLIGIPGLQRFGLYLSADGKWTSRRYSDPNDEQVFLSALALVNWKGNGK